MPVNESTSRSVALEQTYVHDVYEQLNYDNLRSRPWPKVEEFLNELEPGAVVCDVGCGSGKYLNLRSDLLNFGAERSSTLCDLAREKEKEIIRLDNLALPFRDESLDAALSIAVIHHFATTERRVLALRELSRVLRIGGKLIISVWAMEQNHRKFQSQDVLVPCHKPRHRSTPSLELSTGALSENEFLHIYNAYNEMDSSDSNKSVRSKESNKKRSKTKKRCPEQPNNPSSLSSSTLSSPNETCYSFLRRALQRLSGARRIGKQFNPDYCDCYDCLENAKDLPIELRRIDDEEGNIQATRRLTFPSSELSLNESSSFSFKSKSLTNIRTIGSTSCTNSQTSLQDISEYEGANEKRECVRSRSRLSLAKPKLVKQKKSVCEDDANDVLEEPKDLLEPIDVPEFQLLHNKYHLRPRGNVLKQRSLNEELMSTERLQEKEQLRKNIQKQASLQEYITERRVFDNIKDSFFTYKRFNLIKTGFTNKIKSSTTNIEKVTGVAIKNGFVRIFQNWKSTDVSPTIPENELIENFDKKVTNIEEKKLENGERRQSKEESSDSSKDSSLQSDTSVDSEDSFASVIFIPKSENISPILSPGPTSPRLKSNSLFNSLPNSPKLKQSSCPTSPRIKQLPLTLYPLTKQMSNPKPTIEYAPSEKGNKDEVIIAPVQGPTKHQLIKSLSQKYSVQQIPKFRRTSLNTTMALSAVNISNNVNVISTSSISSSNNNDVISTTDSTTTKTITHNSTKSLASTTNTTNTSTVSTISSISIQMPTISISTATPSSNYNNDDITITGITENIDNKKLAENTLVTPGESRNERIRKIREILSKKTGFGARTEKNSSPIVRRTSITNGKATSVGKSLPKLKNLELFNPELDDVDSDSSCISSPDSVDSVIHVETDENDNSGDLMFRFPSGSTRINKKKSYTLLEAAAEVANSLDQTVDKVIKSSPKSRRKAQTSDVLSIMQKYGRETTPLLSEEDSEDNQIHLTDFADELSEKIWKQIDFYQENLLGDCEYVDPYIDRLSEELNDLSKISSEIQKQNEYLNKLSTNRKTPRINGKLNENSRKIVRNVIDEITESRNSFSSEQSTSSSNLSLNLPEYKDRSQRDISNSSDSSESSDISQKTTRSLDSIPSCSELNNASSSQDKISNCSYENQKTISISNDSDCDILKLESATSRFQQAEKAAVSNNSLDSLQSDSSACGEITYHKYYHVFREGELDNLIEKYVENLHIINSYYDHSSWCIIAEKVRVWTI